MSIKNLVQRGKKGRPMGFKLSEASKRAISESKRGQHHKETTKNKISKSLKTYFRKKNPWSEELANYYCSMYDDTTCGWLYDVSDDLNCCLDVLTQKTMFSRLRVEISYGYNIEDIFSHSITPEVLLMYKEYLDSLPEEERE